MSVLDSNIPSDYDDLCFSSSINDATIKMLLENGSLFDEFRTVSATADGHCIIHALCICLSNLLRIDVDLGFYDDMLMKLRSECLTNMSLYLINFTDLCQKTLIFEMISYIYLKRYETYFGDIVPVIMANALSLNVFIILENDDKTYNVHHIKTNKRNATFNVYLLRRGDHYDACIPNVNVHGPKLSATHLNNTEIDYIAPS